MCLEEGVNLWNLTHPWESSPMLVGYQGQASESCYAKRPCGVSVAGGSGGASPLPRWWEPPPAQPVRLFDLAEYKADTLSV